MKFAARSAGVEGRGRISYIARYLKSSLTDNHTLAVRQRA